MHHEICFAFGLALLVTAAPGLAADGTKPPPGGMVLSADGHAMLSADACANLGPSVAGAAYMPGVDVDGNKVAPADLPGPPSMPIENVPIILRHGPALAGGDGNGPIIGEITVRDGRVYFNGVRLAEDDQSALATACRNAKR